MNSEQCAVYKPTVCWAGCGFLMQRKHALATACAPSQHHHHCYQIFSQNYSLIHIFGIKFSQLSMCFVPVQLTISLSSCLAKKIDKKVRLWMEAERGWATAINRGTSASLAADPAPPCPQMHSPTRTSIVFVFVIVIVFDSECVLSVL